MLDHRCANLSEGTKGSVWDLDEDVLGGRAVGSSVLNFFGRVDQELLDVAEVLGLGLLIGNEALGNNLLEFGVLFTLQAVSQWASLTFFLMIFDRLNIV